jgi:hypothetical protein
VLVLLSGLIVSAAIVWAAIAIGRQLAADREARAHDRAVRLLALFAPGLVAATDDARALLVWQPLAATARKMFPQDFAALDQASGGTFPFNATAIEAAHARWSTDWLGWERTHDAEYKLKAAAVEAEIAASGTSSVGRARLDAVEREKLELYQRRYAEYVRVSKALQALRL